MATAMGEDMRKRRPWLGQAEREALTGKRPWRKTGKRGETDVVSKKEKTRVRRGSSESRRSAISKAPAFCAQPGLLALRE
jgi:hypothetical protein